MTASRVTRLLRREDVTIGYARRRRSCDHFARRNVAVWTTKEER